MDYEGLNDNQKRIFRALKNKGYNVSPDAIVANDIEAVWQAEGAFGTTTTTAAPTTTTTTTAAPTTTTTTTAAPTTTTTTTPAP